MGLFGKKKEKEVATTCDCGGKCAPNASGGASVGAEGASVKVLGSGCKKCNDLEAATKEALTELGMDNSIEHVTDFAQIATYGVMSTPALVVDGKVLSFGKVLKKDEVKSLLEQARG